MSDDPSPSLDAQPADPPLDTASGASASPVDKAIWPGPLRYGVGIVLIAIVAAGFILVLPLLQIILLSFLIAFIMFLPSRALAHRTRLPYNVCVLLSFAVAVTIVVVLALLLLPDLLRTVLNVPASLEASYHHWLATLDNVQTGAATAPIDLAPLATALRQTLPGQLTDALSVVAQVLFGLFGNLAGVIASLGTASAVALFFLIDLPITGGAMTNWIPPAYQREIALLFDKLDRLWLKFFRALVIIGAVTAAASFALFVLIGIRSAALLAVVTAIIGLIPVIGRILSILLLVADALINGSTVFVNMDNVAFALLTVVAYLIVTQLIGSIISPKLKGSAINVPTVAIVIGVMVGLLSAGIVGALLITPIIGSLRVFMHYALEKIFLHDPYPGEPMPALQGEGFFSHMLYVKKKQKETEA